MIYGLRNDRLIATQTQQTVSLSAKIAVVAQFVGSAWRENNKSTRRLERNRYDSNETSAP